MTYTGTPRTRSLPETAQRMQAFYSPAFYGPMSVPGAQAPRNIGGFGYMGHYTEPTPTSSPDHPGSVQSWLEALERGKRVNAAFKQEPFGPANLARYGVGQLSNYGVNALAPYRPLADRRYL